MQNKITMPLFLLRLSIFLVMLMWTLDKFIAPQHAAAVYEKFYHLGGLGSSLMWLIAVAELILILLFVVGRFKNITYLAVLLFHAVSTLSSYFKYLDPFNGNLVFFAAWPMLAGCYLLYIMRDEDTRFNL